MKLFVFGIDGASFEIIEGLIHKGYLKNFKTVLEKGNYANMITIPPKTIPMWPCLFSGLNAMQLGFFDFFQNGELFISDKIKGKTCFDVMDKEKKLIFNLPGSYPAWKTNKYMVAGEFAPVMNTYPSQIKNEKIFEDLILHEKPKDLSHCIKTFQTRKNVVKQFMQKEKFDFILFASTFSESAINHLPGIALDGPEYQRAFEEMDNFLGELIKNPCIENIIIMSDHGTHRYNKVFNIKRYLEKKGFFKQSLKKYKVIPFWFAKQTGLSKLYLGFKKRKIKNKSLRFATMKKKSPVKKIYSFGSNFGAIYEKNDDNLLKIKKHLEQEAFIEKVYSTKDLFGHCKEKLPNILIELKENFLFDLQENLFEKRNHDILGHSKRGIFIAYGKDFKSQGKIEDISYLDLSPTILYLFGYEKGSWMTGKVVKDIFNVSDKELKLAGASKTVDLAVSNIRI